MPHRQALVRNNEVLADIAAVQPGERVLDAGCGVGGSSCWLAQHREATVVGITLVPDQVARARAIARARGCRGRRCTGRLMLVLREYSHTTSPTQTHK